MELFREEYLSSKDDYLRVDPSTEESDSDLDYSNDELGENSEVTPLGDAIEDNDPCDRAINPDDDFEEDDLDLDAEDEIEEEEVTDILSLIDPDDEDDLDDDDLLNDDEDDLDEDEDDLDAVIVPDLDDDDLLDDDDDDDFDTTAGAINVDVDFSYHPHRPAAGMW